MRQRGQLKNKGGRKVLWSNTHTEADHLEYDRIDANGQPPDAYNLLVNASRREWKCTYRCTQSASSRLRRRIVRAVS